MTHVSDGVLAILDVVLGVIMQHIFRAPGALVCKSDCNADQLLDRIVLKQE